MTKGLVTVSKCWFSSIVQHCSDTLSIGRVCTNSSLSTPSTAQVAKKFPVHTDFDSDSTIRGKQYNGGMQECMTVRAVNVVTNLLSWVIIRQNMHYLILSTTNIAENACKRVELNNHIVLL